MLTTADLAQSIDRPFGDDSEVRNFPHDIRIHRHAGGGRAPAGDTLLFEYEMLRDEIAQKIELRNTLLVAMYTITVAILAFACTGEGREHPIICLLPMLVVLPLSMRIAYYRDAIAKLSAYMVVFLEPRIAGVCWETRNDCLLRLMGKGRFRHLRTSLTTRVFQMARYLDFFFVNVICIVLFVSYGGAGLPGGGWMCAGALALAAIGLLAAVASHAIEGRRDDWVRRWELVRAGEGERRRV